MHQIRISPAILERVRQLRGPRAAEPMDWRRTAHLVIDMQNGFLEPGAAVEVPPARDIVTNINRVSAAVRAAGGLNIFLRYTYDPDETTPWTRWYDGFCAPEAAERSRRAFLRGAHGHRLWPGLAVHDEDLIVDKTRFSAFTPGTCDLHERLQESGVDTVIISGTLTNCCSESTARDAHQLNYRAIFLADANATLTDEEHNASLNNLCAYFIDVMRVDELLALAAGQEGSAQPLV